MEKIKLLYSRKEELFNGISHFLGALLSVIALISIIIYMNIKNITEYILPVSIFLLTSIILYTMSFLYHISNNYENKMKLRILDHATIFLLISGTYTPYIFIVVPFYEGYLVATFVYVISLIGIILNIINMNNKFVKIYSYIGYVLTGWSITFIYPIFVQNINQLSLILLFVGGIVYTLGFIFYGIGKKKKWFHFIWHIFVLLGTILHAISILFLIIN